ncbi:hypothetical protein HY251_14590, partial [bacterium]|nr:hypothetical protein [bacterium]
SVGMGGIDRVFKALRKALEDGNPQVAVKLIEVLQGLHVTSDMLPGGGSVSIEQKPMDLGNGPGTSNASSAATSQPSQVTPPADKPAETPKDKPAETPKDKPADTPGDKPADMPKDKPAETPGDKPAETPGEKPPEGGSEEKPKKVGLRPGATRKVFADSTGGGANGESLCAALVYPDKRVRYAAAICLANLNPSRPFSNQDKVVENLMDALSETGQRVVLVVERDLDLKNKIVGLLRESGYMVFATQSGNDGINRAKSFPGEDLIIVSSELNPDTTANEPVEFQFIQQLQEDYRTKTIPCIVLTPSKRSVEMQKLVDEKLAVDVITPDIDRITIDGRIKKIFEGEEYKRDEKARNDDVAKRAALAIASIPQDHTVLDVGKVAPALASCLAASRPDDVKIAAMKAIQTLGPKARAACLDTLTNLLKTKTNSVDVREGAAQAIGECIKGQAVSGDTFQVLKEAFGETPDEERIWKPVGLALGKATLTGDQAREVFEAHRID